MVPGSKKKLVIQHGDLVELVYDVTSFSKKTLYGRIYAKLTPQYSSSTYRNKQTYYIVKPEKKFEEEIRANDALLEALLSMMDPFPGLEWGQVPPMPYITVPETMLSPLFGSAMESRFKKNGLCPRCGDRGYWKAMALFCPWHGRFMC